MFWDGTRWVDERPTPTPAVFHGPRRLRDWIATIPIVLLVPALLFPFLPAMATTTGPALTVSGPAIAGATVAVKATGFTSGTLFQLQWDGSPSGMPTERTRTAGAVTLNVRVPSKAKVGTHVLSAVLPVWAQYAVRFGSALDHAIAWPHGAGIDQRRRRDDRLRPGPDGHTRRHPSPRGRPDGDPHAQAHRCPHGGSDRCAARPAAPAGPAGRQLSSQPPGGGRRRPQWRDPGPDRLRPVQPGRHDLQASHGRAGSSTDNVAAQAQRGFVELSGGGITHPQRSASNATIRRMPRRRGREQLPRRARRSSPAPRKASPSTAISAASAASAASPSATARSAAANTVHAYSAGNEAGGIKFVAADNVTISGSTVSHNGGPGIWCDGARRTSTISDNRVHGNDDAGIMVRDVPDVARHRQRRVGERLGRPRARPGRLGRRHPRHPSAAWWSAATRCAWCPRRDHQPRAAGRPRHRRPATAGTANLIALSAGRTCHDRRLRRLGRPTHASATSPQRHASCRRARRGGHPHGPRPRPH